MKKLWLMCMLISSAINAQTFDFSCDTLTGYIADFIEDSGRKNLQLSGRLLSRAEIDSLGLRVLAYPDGIPSYVVAFALPCSNEFVYVKERWHTNPDPNFRKKIVYHELGHAVFGYHHPSTPAGFNGYLWDIMGYNDLVAGDSNWNHAKNRFFGGTDHTGYNCGTGKGGVIIDN